MFNLQGGEIIFILLLALVVLGPEKLPSTIRRFMQTYAELRKMGTGFQSELKSALDEPMREMRETANVLRDAADPAKVIADAEREPPTGRPSTVPRPVTMENAADAVDSADSADSGATVAGVVDGVVDEWADPVDPDPPGDIASEEASA